MRGLGQFDWGALLGSTLSQIGSQVSRDAAAKAAADAKAAGATDAEAKLKAAEEGRAAAERALRQVSAEASRQGGYPPAVLIGGAVLGLTTLGALFYAFKR